MSKLTPLAPLAADPAEFRKALLIDANGTPTPFAPDEWQAEDFRTLDPGWLRAIGKPTNGKVVNKAYLERARGHSKSHDIATMATYALFACPRPCRLYAIAADKDQAKLLLGAVQTLVCLNDWLRPFITIQEHRAINPKTGSTLDVLSSDGPSSYGLTPDAVICDELCNWRGEELWTSLLSASAKRRNSITVVITNAGFQEHWSWRVREAVRADPSWYFHSLPGSQASWIDPARLAEQARLLPTASFDRLWQNMPQSGSGEGIDPGLIDAAIDPNISPTMATTSESFVLGVDLGLKSDFAAVCAIGKSSKGLRLAHSEVWKPRSQLFGLVRSKEINLQEVRDRIKELHTRFQFYSVLLDPWQSGQMTQELLKMGVPAEARPFNAAFRMVMATTVLNGFRDRRIKLYRDDNLIRDLKRCRIVERLGGFSIQWPRDTGGGHGDAGCAFCIALAGSEEAPEGEWCEPALKNAPPPPKSLVRELFERIGMIDPGDYDPTDNKARELADGATITQGPNPFQGREAWSRHDNDR